MRKAHNAHEDLRSSIIRSNDSGHSNGLHLLHGARRNTPPRKAWQASA
ncbi:hypothetical protein [Pseudomonas syringae]|nr:hypothetical protein [Pseudomonas syringae]